MQRSIVQVYLAHNGKAVRVCPGQSTEDASSARDNLAQTWIIGLCPWGVGSGEVGKRWSGGVPVRDWWGIRVMTGEMMRLMYVGRVRALHFRPSGVRCSTTGLE